MPHVSIYLDAAHAGWLGWGGNRAKAIFKDVLAQAGGADKIRGFFVNVSSYNVLRGDDGKRMEASNQCPNELTYVAELADTLRWSGITRKWFIIDTGRNGRGGLRKKWGSWCNVNHAGLGERPRAAPEPFVDAYFWIKPPGESDGTSDPSAAPEISNVPVRAAFPVPATIPISESGTCDDTAVVGGLRPAFPVPPRNHHLLGRLHLDDFSERHVPKARRCVGKRGQRRLGRWLRQHRPSLGRPSTHVATAWPHRSTSG